MDRERVGVFEHEVVGPETELFLWSTPKFKATSVRLTMIEPLDHHVATRALLTSLLKRGCRSFPDMTKLSRELERQYGASLGLDVLKIGERHVTNARLRQVNDRFVGGSGDALRDGLSLLREVLLEPVVEDDGFRRAEFDQEQLNLVRAIQGLVDDKISWAHQRFVEEMFAGEPYARFEWGSEQEANALDPVSTLAMHRSRLSTAPMRIYAVGDLADADRATLREFAAGLVEGRRPDPVAAEPLGPAASPKTITEELEVAQSKLHVGYRLSRSPSELSDREYYALGLMNAVLGGGSGLAKLFKEVREKRGLAYYAHSSLDRLKGSMVLSAGVLASKWEEAALVMREQVDALRDGDVADEELDVARATIVNALESIPDSAAQTVDFVHAARLTGRPADLATVRAEVEAVTKEDVVRAAALPEEGLTYCLIGTDEG